MQYCGKFENQKSCANDRQIAVALFACGLDENDFIREQQEIINIMGSKAHKQDRPTFGEFPPFAGARITKVDSSDEKYPDDPVVVANAELHDVKKQREAVAKWFTIPRADREIIVNLIKCGVVSAVRSDV